MPSLFRLYFCFNASSRRIKVKIGSRFFPFFPRFSKAIEENATKLHGEESKEKGKKSFLRKKWTKRKSGNLRRLRRNILKSCEFMCLPRFEFTSRCLLRICKLLNVNYANVAILAQCILYVIISKRVTDLSRKRPRVKFAKCRNFSSSHIPFHVVKSRKSRKKLRGLSFVFKSDFRMLNRRITSREEFFNKKILKMSWRYFIWFVVKSRITC